MRLKLTFDSLSGRFHYKFQPCDNLSLHTETHFEPVVGAFFDGKALIF